MNLSNPVDIAIQETKASEKYVFSICTLVTDKQEYGEMIQSFIDAGFTTADCEFRFINNSTANAFDAYSGLNQFLTNALGKYIILCHQDILLDFDKRIDLEQRIAEMDSKDGRWGILSNAGGVENDLYQRAAINVAYPDGFHQRVGSLPEKVSSVDENFIVVKRSANLALSGNLVGFHLYGTDLCLVAELLGYSAYAINFKIIHKSYGTPNESYYSLLKQLIDKYVHFMRDRHIITTIADFYLSASPFRSKLFETKFFKKVARKVTKVRKHKKW